VRSVFERVHERGAFGQTFGAQKFAGLARTGPCRVARARATSAAVAAHMRLSAQNPRAPAQKV